MSLINIQNISAGYSKENVIENISFEINEGELVGVLGANGSGKSTLAKAICNILPHKGTVTVNDSVIEKLNVAQTAKHISYISQRSGLNLDISVTDVVKMGFNPELKVFESPNKAMDAEARSVIEKLGLYDKADTDYMLLSEGQKQMVIMARALVSKGTFMVMDEPESALDFNVRINIIKSVRDWISAGNRAGLIILHDVMLALNNCDKIILLKDKSAIAMIDMHNDSIEETERKLKLVYGDVSLLKVKSKKENEQYIMLFESEAE